MCVDIGGESFSYRTKKIKKQIKGLLNKNAKKVI
jgi:hypothetical protein